MRKFAAISLAGIMAFGAFPVMAEETSTEEASTEAATEAGSEAAESDQVENNWEPKAMIPAREIAANFLIIELLLSLKIAYYIFQPSFSHVYIVERL